MAGYGSASPTATQPKLLTEPPHTNLSAPASGKDAERREAGEANG